MDEMTLLRELAAETRDPDPAVLLRARRRLLQRAVSPAVRRRRRLVRVGLAAAAVTVVASGLVLAETSWRGDDGVVASAEAAAVLQRAADATVAQVDPVVAPDQFLKVSSRWQYSSGGEGADGRPFMTLDAGTTTHYIPGDQAREWVMVSTPRRVIEVFYGQPPTDGRAPDEVSIERAADGAFHGMERGDWSSPSEEYLDALPRDPVQLEERIRDVAGDSGQSRDGEVIVLIGDLLRTGLVPADLRAALFEVAQSIPGVEVTDRSVVLDGREGVAIGRLETASGTRQELVFDKETGLLIGEREVATGWDRLPAGTTVASTAVTTEVVDSAP